MALFTMRYQKYYYQMGVWSILFRQGLIKVHSDMTRITMTLEGLYPEYADTLRCSSEETEELKDVLSAFGFERSDLKTLNFSVDTEFESYKEKGASTAAFPGTILCMPHGKQRVLPTATSRCISFFSISCMIRERHCFLQNSWSRSTCI